MSILAVSCQKEEYTEVDAITDDVAVYTLNYSIDGATYHATFKNQTDRLAFIRHLVALAREGHHVSIADSNTLVTNTSKEKVTYTTNSSSDAAAWAEKMVLQGYEVEIFFDDATGIYTCIATK